MTFYASPDLYKKYKDVILEYTSAKQRYELGAIRRGLTDAEIAEKLGIASEEATEVRCIAELDLTASQRYFEADAWKQRKFNEARGTG